MEDKEYAEMMESSNKLLFEYLEAIAILTDEPNGTLALKRIKHLMRYIGAYEPAEDWLDALLKRVHDEMSSLTKTEDKPHVET